MRPEYYAVEGRMLLPLRVAAAGEGALGFQDSDQIPPYTSGDSGAFEDEWGMMEGGTVIKQRPETRLTGATLEVSLMIGDNDDLGLNWDLTQ